VRAAILGATKGMGRELARQMAARGDHLFLLGRDADDLERSVADLRARAGAGANATFAHAACDLERPEGFAEALEAAEAGLGGLDAVIVTAGLFATQEALEADVELARRVATVNYANTLAFCEHARKRLLARGGGRLVVFSSVAGERARKPVVIYGSGKAGLSAYLEGLDHRFHAQGLQVVCVKPGFVKTSMTAGLKPPPFAGEPEQVARQVLARLDRPRPVVYTPRMWALVMFVIRLLPRFVMRRIQF
jgi:short-subunit dehydrogenase